MPKAPRPSTIPLPIHILTICTIKSHNAVRLGSFEQRSNLIGQPKNAATPIQHEKVIAEARAKRKISITSLRICYYEIKTAMYHMSKHRHRHMHTHVKGP